MLNSGGLLKKPPNKSEESRIGQREALNCCVIAAQALAELTGRSGARMAPRRCPEFR